MSDMDARKEIDAIVKCAAGVLGMFSKAKGGMDNAPAPRLSKRVAADAKVPTSADPRPMMMLNPKEGKFQWAYDFYKDIAPAIRMRQLGVSKLPENEQAAFNRLGSVPVAWVKELPREVAGRHYNNAPGMGEYIALREGNKKDGTPYATPRVLVHELRHALERSIPTNKKDTDFLNRIFGFIGVDINPDRPGYSKVMSREEMLTTNKEHQFRVYERLRNKLGRPPKPDEYFKYIDEIPLSELYNDNRWTPVNKYQEIADKALRAIMRRTRNAWGRQDYIKALKEISSNRNIPTQGSWRYFASGYEGGRA